MEEGARTVLGFNLGKGKKKKKNVNQKGGPSVLNFGL